MTEDIKMNLQVDLSKVNKFDYLIDYYSHLQTKNEENQTVENSIPLIMQLSKHKKMIDTAKVQSDKKEDKEVKLVNLFIADLNQAVDEMEKVEKNHYYEVILEAKLFKLMKVYGDSLYLGSVINIYRSHYNYVLKQREEESYQSVYTGIYFEYKGLSTKVEQLNCVNEDRYSCSDGRLKDSTIPKLYEKFKNKIDS